MMDYDNYGDRTIRRSERKRQYKHAVAIVDIVDRLAYKETEPEKVRLLNQLRKEVKRYGYN